MGAPGCGPRAAVGALLYGRTAGCPSRLSPLARQSRTLPWPGWGMALPNPAVHVRTPTCSVETPPRSPGFPQLQPVLLWIGCPSPQHGLNSVLVTARTTSVLRDCKVIFVERFCLRLDVVLRALEDRDAGSFKARSLGAFCPWTS